MTLPIVYEIRQRCNICLGTGQVRDPSVAPPGSMECENCHGKGYYNDHTIPTGLLEAFIEVTNKIQEVKTKINQIQADINYIKAKVG